MHLIIFEKILNSLSLTGKIVQRLGIFVSQAPNKWHENANKNRAMNRTKRP